MEPDSFQERTEPASSKRRQEARQMGNVAKSKELPAAFVLLGSLLLFFFTGGALVQRLSELMRQLLATSGTFSIQHDAIYQLLLQMLRLVILMVAPVLLVVIVASIAGNLLQTGFLFTFKPLEPRLSRLSIIQGLKRLCSLSSLVELIKSIFKIMAVGAIAYMVVKGEVESIPSLMQLGIQAVVSFIGAVSFRVCFYPCVTLVMIALLDYGFQRWQYEKNLRMTKQEVREELKQREGDPLVKARVRRIQLEMARRRMMEAVREADVVITNPTSLAIALKYSAETMSAPRVIAKGAGFIAERIREIAQEHLIPIVENKPLAQTLFKVVEIGDYIPVSFYRAVAEILAYVYRLKNQRRQT